MWATSIGSTFSHRPLPGERKSGIPEGTETPAPVSATTERASRISSASACTLASTATAALLVTPASSPSATLEARLALAQEGADALARVGRREQLREAL